MPSVHQMKILDSASWVLNSRPHFGVVHCTNVYLELDWRRKWQSALRKATRNKTKKIAVRKGEGPRLFTQTNQSSPYLPQQTFNVVSRYYRVQLWFSALLCLTNCWHNALSLPNESFGCCSMNAQLHAKIENSSCTNVYLELLCYSIRGLWKPYRLIKSSMLQISLLNRFWHLWLSKPF